MRLLCGTALGDDGATRRGVNRRGNKLFRVCTRRKLEKDWGRTFSDISFAAANFWDSLIFDS